MKTFDNDNVFHHHKKGKRHIKSINKLSKTGLSDQVKQAPTEEGLEFN